MADRFVALPAQCVADKCAVFGRPPVRRMRYLRACPAVTRFAIVFTGRPLSKNHRCCPDAAGFNAPKSWAGVFHVAKYKKGAFLAAHPSRHREYNRSGRAAAEIVEMPNTFYQGILRLVKAASLLQCPFDDKKDALVTKHLSGRSAGSSSCSSNHRRLAHLDTTIGRTAPSSISSRTVPPEALRSPSRGTSSTAAEIYPKPPSKRLLRERKSRCTPHSKKAVFAPKAWIS